MARTSAIVLQFSSSLRLNVLSMIYLSVMLLSIFVPISPWSGFCTLKSDLED